MNEIRYRDRRACKLDNGLLEIIVTVEGGHIAAVIDKQTGLNPLWTPPWPSIEPSQYDSARHTSYGGNSESQLLAGILGHNLCMDLFGGPSESEAAAGMTVHGEASIATYDIEVVGDTLTEQATFPHAQLRFERRIRLPAGSRSAAVSETVENLSIEDRPIAWTNHVTLGPPFLQKGQTRFAVSATKSKVVEHDFTAGKGYMKIGAEFEWPMVPLAKGGAEDLQLFTDRPVSGAFSTHLMDPARTKAFFIAWTPSQGAAFGYSWDRADFPWLGIWEENLSRTSGPWDGKTITRGMEFGVSPFPESRRAMIERGHLFGERTYRWIPAKTKVSASYHFFLIPAQEMPTAPLIPATGRLGIA